MLADHAMTFEALAAIVLVAGAIVTWVRWLRPKIRNGVGQVVGVRDSILGRDAIVDTITGRQLAPALPGVGVRLADQERLLSETSSHLGTLSTAVAAIAESHKRLENHEERIIRLEGAVVERIVGHADSAAAWGAVEATTKAEPPKVVAE